METSTISFSTSARILHVDSPSLHSDTFDCKDENTKTAPSLQWERRRLRWQANGLKPKTTAWKAVMIDTKMWACVRYTSYVMNDFFNTSILGPSSLPINMCSNFLILFRESQTNMYSDFPKCTNHRWKKKQPFFSVKGWGGFMMIIKWFLSFLKRCTENLLLSSCHCGICLLKWTTQACDFHK